jgi:hypothetical protein
VNLLSPRSREKNIIHCFDGPSQGFGQREMVHPSDIELQTAKITVFEAPPSARFTVSILTVSSARTGASSRCIISGSLPLQEQEFDYVSLLGPIPL